MLTFQGVTNGTVQLFNGIMGHILAHQRRFGMKQLPGAGVIESTVPVPIQNKETFLHVFGDGSKPFLLFAQFH